MTFSKKQGFVLIAFSAMLSWTIANVGINHLKLEMASIANMFLPPICGATSLLAFALTDYFFVKQRQFWIIIFIFINLVVGIAIRLESEAIIRNAT